MPDLSDRDVPVAKYLLPQLLVGHVAADPLGLYLREFVRLVDKAIFEYEDARVAFETGCENHRCILPHIAFTNHFETCVNAIARLLKLLDRIARVHSDSSSTRTIRKMAQACGRNVCGARGAVEHMAEDIQSGRQSIGKPVMLMLSEDGREVIIGDNQILLTNVASALKALQKVALAILQENSQSPLPETK